LCKLYGMGQWSQPAAGRRAQVLEVLREAGTSLSIGQIAERLGVHVNTVRFHLGTLVGTGQVERMATLGGLPGRPPQLFRAKEGMDPGGPRHYRLLAELLAAGLAAGPDPYRRAIQAGRDWGRGQASSVAGSAGSLEPGAAVEQLTAMLDDMGFAPQPIAAGDGTSIALRHCPFLELAVDRAEVVCPIHLGLMQGAMQAWDSALIVDRLEAFVEPGLCLAHLTTEGAPR